MSSQDRSDMNPEGVKARSTLDEFRETWQRELLGERHVTQSAIKIALSAIDEQRTDTNTSDLEWLQVKAENFYRIAVGLEQRGKVYDALPFYRKAMQLVPDIEFKFYEIQKQSNDANKKYHNLSNDFTKQLDISNATNVEVIDNLYEKFQRDFGNDVYGGKIILNIRDPSVLFTDLHISDLPPEIFMQILKWVISSQLDMKSLEQCAAVCKGFYVYARDEELWRLACEKVWGHNMGTLNDVHNDGRNSCYYSWRDMFLRRERVHFNGCYISKTTYLRIGENSFQDQFYRPVQLVEYYRYIRFLPDGKVIMMTSADEPTHGVGKLKQLHNIRPDVLRGHYRLFGNSVTLVLQKSQARPQDQLGYMRRRRGSVALVDTDANKKQYVIEFRITNTTKRPFVQLVWLHYSLVQKRNNLESSSIFDITATKYPPLWFSPVKSYHLEADAPLA